MNEKRLDEMSEEELMELTMEEATLKGLREAVEERPNSTFLKNLLKTEEDKARRAKLGGPDDSSTLWHAGFGGGRR